MGRVLLPAVAPIESEPLDCTLANCAKPLSTKNDNDGLRPFTCSGLPATQRDDGRNSYPGLFTTLSTVLLPSLSSLKKSGLHTAKTDPRQQPMLARILPHRIIPCFPLFILVYLIILEFFRLVFHT